MKFSMSLKIKFLESYTMSAGVSKVTDFFEVIVHSHAGLDPENEVATNLRNVGNYKLNDTT